MARDYLDPAGVIVQSGENLAAAVVAQLGQHDRVILSMADMPPVSSSFFNIVFRRVTEQLGLEALLRIEVTDLFPTIGGVVVRSRAAFLAPAHP